MSSPYQTPASNLVNADQTTSLQGYKRFVISDPGAQWPNRCYKCNAPTDYKKTVNLYYLNPWWYLTILIALIITLIVYFVARKKFVVDLPMCELHQRKRKRFVTLQIVLLLVFLGSMGVAIITEQDVYVLISMLSFVGLLITAIGGRIITVVKYKNDKIWITGAGKAFINSLPATDPR